jgi:hypothetical protein
VSTISITLAAAPTVGRHRLGRPGLVPLSALGILVRRGLLSWFRVGRHRWTAPRAGAGRPQAAPVPAAV